MRQATNDSEEKGMANYSPEQVTEWRELINKDIALYDYAKSRFDHFSKQLPGFADVLHRIQS